MYGIIRVAAAIPLVTVADCIYNSKEILKLIFEAKKEGVKIIVFPELSITSYSCQDLFYQQSLIAASSLALKELVKESFYLDIIISVGMPIVCDNKTFNCSVIIHAGKILGVVCKTYLPNYNE
ncbi:MAG: nitrilase-related carbon-nitrogen hydrolase, partial [Anaerotignaceae bacterium]